MKEKGKKNRRGAAALALGCALVCAGCGGGEARPPLEPLSLHADSQWIRDSAGRVVLLRGADYSGLEFGNFIGKEHGPEDANFAQMENWGLGVIRLPIAWSFIEPSPGQLDDRYLREQVDTVVGFAAAHGIGVILEMHQYSWSTCTGGNGAPSWVCDGHNYPNDFTAPLLACCDFFQGGLAPDGRKLLDHYVDVWRLVGSHYAGDAQVVGFDFFNEPNAIACLQTGDFEREVLHPLYRGLHQTLLDAGATQTRFYCPSMARNTGGRIPTEPIAGDWVYAPHLYTGTYGQPDLKYNGDRVAVAADYAQALDEATGMSAPLWVAEYGGSTVEDGGFRQATEDFILDSLDEQERRLVGSAVWAYFPSDNTFSLVDASGAEKGNLVNRLVRPYARRIAGLPTQMRYDPGTRVLSLAFRDDPAAHPKDPTEIVVPDRLYPSGFDVTAGDGDDFEIPKGGGRVLLYRGFVGEHTARIAPKGSP